MSLKLYKFRDVSTRKTAKIKASSPYYAIKRYENRRRKSRYKPNWEFLD